VNWAVANLGTAAWAPTGSAWLVCPEALTLGFYIYNPENGHRVHVKFAGRDAGKISFQPGPDGGPYGYFKDALNGFIEGFNQAI
jgi:hypothetical protein